MEDQKTCKNATRGEKAVKTILWGLQLDSLTMQSPPPNWIFCTNYTFTIAAYNDAGLGPATPKKLY